MEKTQKSGAPKLAVTRSIGVGIGLAVTLIVAGIAVVWLINGGQDRALGTSVEKPPVETAEIVKEYPHDSSSFTQGLVVENNVMHEGTGKYGQSELREMDMNTGKPVRSMRLPETHFGEGIAAFGDEIFQLTWKNREVFVYDRATLQYKRKHRYTGEGWGLTHDGKNLIMSDGTSVLRFLDPKTFQVVKRLTVRHPEGGRQEKLNELEFVNGEIYANIWYADYVARISPKTGEILGWIDLRNLWPAQDRPNVDAVLNGIAYDPATKRLFITGKNWPKLFEVRIPSLATKSTSTPKSTSTSTTGPPANATTKPD